MLMNDTRLKADGDLAGLGQTVSFTMKADAKAFRMFIDSLYSDKIKAPLRELASNAFDAHTRAGIPEVPFEVTLPTDLDPVFSVRDFGPGMSHADTMTLYTTMFQSDKDDSNAEVGGFGIGSKSPFAYTDTFSVTIFDGTEARDYFAHLQASGIPALTHLETRPCQDRRGMQVSFPVQPQDLWKFRNKWDDLHLGFPVPPTVFGHTPPKARQHDFEGDNWTMRYSQDSGWSGTVNIRQGCVLYPVTHWVNVRSNQHWIIDAPVGTFEVTATREALARTPDTEDMLEQLFEKARIEMEVQLREAVRRAPNIVEAYRMAHRVFTFFEKDDCVWHNIELGDPRKGYVTVPRVTDGKGNARDRLAWSSFGPGFKLLVTRPGQKIPRQASRLAAWRKANKAAWELVDHADLKRFIRTTGIDPKDVVSLATIPDVTPPRRDGRGTGEVKGIYDGKNLMMAEDFPEEWIIWDGNRHRSVLRQCTDTSIYRVVPSSMDRAKRLGGVETSSADIVAPYMPAANQWAENYARTQCLRRYPQAVRDRLDPTPTTGHHSLYSQLTNYYGGYNEAVLAPYPLLNPDADETHLLAYMDWCDANAAALDPTP